VDITNKEMFFIIEVVGGAILKDFWKREKE